MRIQRNRGQRQDKLMQANGLYVHSSPPRVLQLNSAHIKQIIRSGDIDKLESIVFDGQGKKLVGEYSSDFKTRTFLKKVPNIMSKISLLHDAVNSGRLEELQSLLEEETNEKTKKRLILAKDEAGVGLLHKAVYYDLKDIAEWIIKNYPHTVSSKDTDGRTPYIYTPMCQSPQNMQKLLKMSGADPAAVDNRQRSAKYYKDHVAELELPSPHKSTASSRRSTANVKESLNIKKSNIRIWIHQKDLNKLQQVVWEGHGSKLLVEHSNNPKVKKFLDALPHILGAIKETHASVINDDFEALKAVTNPPAPNILFIAKDANGLTPLHKAAGLGRQEIAEYIIAQNPKSVTCIDNEGRTPLHYSVLQKDGGKMFDYLLEAGADEGVIDNKQKSAAFYKTRNNEIDAKVLQLIPDCPRQAKDPQNFDWAFLGVAVTPSEEMAKLIEMPEEIFGNETVEAEAEPEITLNGNSEEADEVNNNEEEETHENGVAEENGEAEMIEAEAAAEVEEEPPTEAADAPEVVPEVETADGEVEVFAEEVVAAVEEEEAEAEVEAHVETEAKSEVEAFVEAEADELEPELEMAVEAEADAVEEAAAEAENEVDAPTEAEVVDEAADMLADINVAEAAAEDEVEGAIEKPEPVITEPESDSEPDPEADVNNAEENVLEDEIESELVESEGVIEGIVNGENEIESVNEEGQGVANGDKDDADITAMVESGNMEQLAGLVLNGDGDKLLGHASNVPELQSFLDNVPVYMGKINKIHLASREGSLKELQAALDRRKFAIAKDKISPNGATPLHVATVFGNTSIVRYLAGRFPETVTANDDNGRSPLHYAAVVPDNGHYYNLLVHLGANTRAEDTYGHTPEFYRLNQSDFSHKLILRDYGAEDLADEILNDQVPDDSHSSRKELDDEDMIAVLDRCYTVLHGRRNSNASSAASVATTASNINTNPYSVLCKYSRRYVFDEVKSRVTKFDHNLYDIIWPSVKKLPTDLTFRGHLEQDFPAGIIAPDLSAYKVFECFLLPIIKDVNNIDVHMELPNHALSKFVNVEEKNDDGTETIIEVDLDLDTGGKNILSGSLECSRNLENFELPNYLNVDELEMVERIITSSLLSNDTAEALYPNATADEIEEKGCGTYYTMNEILEDPSEARVILASNGLMIPLWNIPDSDRLHGKQWPYGRGVFVSNSCNLAVWINVLDHLRIITCTSSMKPGNIGQIYSRIYRLMNSLNSKIQFLWDDKLGFLSARPTNVGNTLQFYLNVRFPHLIKEPDNLRHLCHVRGLKFQRNTHSSDVVRIGNQQCLGITELQCFEDFCTAVANIMQLEKDLAMSNSMHIAALFVNMFKRKKTTVDY